MCGFYEKCLKLVKQNRKVSGLNWDCNIEEILAQFVEILNEVLADTEYYAERNSTVGEKNVDIFKKGVSGRVGHLWPRKRDQIIHVNFTNDIVEQLERRMDMPQDTDVKKGRYLNWRAYKELDYATTMKIVSELAEIGKR